LQRQLLSIRAPAQKYDAIRRFRRRETLRIGARDLTGGATVEETTLELSNLADVCLQSVFEIALGSLRAQYRLKPNAALATDRFSIIGMGKLGGQELNYSSDVDVIFIYGEEGILTATLTNHQFFTKLAEESFGLSLHPVRGEYLPHRSPTATRGEIWSAGAVAG